MIVVLVGVVLLTLSTMGVARENVYWVVLPPLACGAMLLSAFSLEMRMPREDITSTSASLRATEAISMDLTYVPDEVVSGWISFVASNNGVINMGILVSALCCLAMAIFSIAIFPRRSRPDCTAVITGIAAGLPGEEEGKGMFARERISQIFRGENLIEVLDEDVALEMRRRNIVQVKKTKDGPIKIPCNTAEAGIKLSATMREMSLTQYGVSPAIAATMDKASQYAVAAGLEAARDAGLVTGEGQGLAGWELPEELRDGTAVIYASSFPGFDAIVAECMRYLSYQECTNAPTAKLIGELRRRLNPTETSYTPTAKHTSSTAPLNGKSKNVGCNGTNGANGKIHNGANGDSTHVVPNGHNDDAPQDMETLVAELERHLAAAEADAGGPPKAYVFDRKLLFKVLVLANGQLAQILKARGPNTCSNAACAGTTQAIAMAHDWIRLRQVDRVFVISGDNASGATLMPWLGSGFRALGAATIGGDPRGAARPFDTGRSGMLMGSGACALVLERQESLWARKQIRPVKSPQPVRLIDTHICNSAYHGASMDAVHIGQAMCEFMRRVEESHGISRRDVARRGIYLSHETMTHASPTASCSFNEVTALRQCFGDDLKNLLLLNTKGFTGHPMGVSFEDIVAIEALRRQEVPPIANLCTATTDPMLGEIKLSKGGGYTCQYALRFAAGFGSHVALALYGI